MPADFFADLLLDLYSIPEGHEIALLTLLHPKQDVRDVVVATLGHLMENITLSSTSLSRLQVIKSWYPSSYHEQFNKWIKLQRKKGVVFRSERPTPTIQIKASEVDGSGAQGIFIQVKEGRKKPRLCGLLFKQEMGIKDAWITPPLSNRDVSRYYKDAFGDNITLRDVELSYLIMMANHFFSYHH